MISHKLEREFREIEATDFWKEFMARIEEDKRLAIVNLTRDPDIGESCVKGQIWQGRLRLIEKIEKMPRLIVGYEDNPEGPSTKE